MNSDWPIGILKLAYLSQWFQNVILSKPDNWEELNINSDWPLVIEEAIVQNVSLSKTEYE